MRPQNTRHTRERRKRQHARLLATEAQAERARAEWLAQFTPRMRDWIVRAFPAEMVGTPLLAVVVDRAGQEGVVMNDAGAAAIIASVRTLQEKAKRG